MNLFSIFISTTEQKILRFLAYQFGESFFDKEIAQKTKLSRGATNLALRNLAKKGLILKEKKGRMNFYKVDIYNPIIKQFKVLEKIISLYSLVQNLQEFSSKVILFGSSARGEDTSDSDIDLFVLTREEKSIKKIIDKFKKTKIKPIIKNQNNWAELEKKDKIFSEEIKRGIILYENYE